MTNKEKIAILTHNWKYRELIDNPYQYEALDHAIKALGVCDRIKAIIDGWAVDDDEHELLERIADIMGGEEK